MSGKLKTAILGLDEQAMLLLQAASECEYFQIEAVADKDALRVEKTAERYNCTAYDDYRQLIIQNHFDCLLVADAIYNCEEYIKTAMKKKINILKLSPPARNFEEAAELVKLAEEQNIQFAIANQNRFAKSWLKLQQLLNQKQFRQISIISAICTTSNNTPSTWQSDPKLAGGGVLLYDCYETIDLIMANFPLPEQIYSLNTNHAIDRQQRLYLTEDIAVMSMKFNDVLFGSLIASRAFGPEQKTLKLYGKENVIIVSNGKLLLEDKNGRIIEKFNFNDNKISCMTKLLENFAISILSPDKNNLISSARENLINMATIEAAYLSARTAMPEEPAKILKMELNQPTNIWPVHK